MVLRSKPPDRASPMVLDPNYAGFSARMGRYGTISAHEGSWVQCREFRAYRASEALSAVFCLFVRVFGRIQRLDGRRREGQQHRGDHRGRCCIADLFRRLWVPQRHVILDDPHL